MLSDRVHQALQLVLTEDVKLPFELTDFEKLSLHALGSSQNLILIAPTGSGKMMVIWLGSLLMRRVLEKPDGVTVGTQPLSVIMEEKLANRLGKSNNYFILIEV